MAPTHSTGKPCPDGAAISTAAAQVREAAIDAGVHLAAQIFAKRPRQVEVHLNQAQLAAVLAVAFERGVRHAQDAQRPQETEGSEPAAPRPVSR